MAQGVKRTQRDYSLSFKLAVVDQIEKGEMTYSHWQDQIKTSVTDPSRTCHMNATAQAETF